MKIALLECDQVHPELRYIGGGYRDMFSHLFSEFTFEFFNLCKGDFPASVHDHEGFICTGSKYSVYDDIDWIKELKNFVGSLHQQQRPYVGICFGHQMLAEALDGKVEKAETGWCVGAHEFEVVQQKEWMTPYSPSVNLLMSCQDQISILPSGSTMLARGRDCPNGIFQVGSNMLGVQAHPEFPKDYSRQLMERRKERVGSQKVELGMKSLESPLNVGTVKNWIYNFIRYQ